MKFLYDIGNRRGWLSGVAVTVVCAGVQQPVELFTDAALSKAVYPALESLQIRF